MHEQEQAQDDGAQESVQEEDGIEKTDQEFKAAGSKAKEATKKADKEDENMNEIDPDAGH